MHRRIRATLVALPIFTQLLTGCSALGVAQSTLATLDSPITSTAPAPTISVGASEYPGCSYTWSTRELPALTRTVEAKVGALGPEATGSAYAFGEECRREDGTLSFLPMQTDFRIRVGVDSLSDEESMGNWITAVMTQIEALPREELAGARLGRVEFEFYVHEAESRRLIIEIARYRAEAAGLQGASLFNHFASP